MKKIITLALLLMLTFFNYIYADSNKEAYELQERCGKQAREFFKNKYAGRDFEKTTFKDENNEDKTTWSNTDYFNHYNNKLNKCFVLTESQLFVVTKKSHSVNTLMKQLIDINENKEYGQFNNISKHCYVAGKSCATVWKFAEDEFDALVKPYMEE